MELKDIKLRKGMTKDEVNKLTKDYILLEDEVYIGNHHKHNWRCLCGDLIEGRRWANISKEFTIQCKKCKHNKKERMYKEKVEDNGEYEYIRAYFKGDILPNGKLTKIPYIQVKHKYCGSVYEVQAGSFINDGRRCSKCCHTYENSFAYHIEVELGESLEKYWDFEKNTVNPYLINKYRNGKNKNGENLKVWIRCQEKDYHGSYEISCNDFVKGRRCSYCGNHKTHPLDSFGYKYPDKAKCWHEDNDKSPYEVAPSSRKKYKFRCDECGNIWDLTLYSVAMDVWCPKCSGSKGEKRISKWLDDIAIRYNMQFKFNDCRFKAPLPFDFYLPDYNLLIEYDGIQHFKPISYFGDTIGFQNTKIRDAIKNEYCKKNNIKLIRIPYWEFDNIEYILDKELNTYSKVS